MNSVTLDPSTVDVPFPPSFSVELELTNDPLFSHVAVFRIIAYELPSNRPFDVIFNVPLTGVSPVRTAPVELSLEMVRFTYGLLFGGTATS